MHLRSHHLCRQTTRSLSLQSHTSAAPVWKFLIPIVTPFPRLPWAQKLSLRVSQRPQKANPAGFPRPGFSREYFIGRDPWAGQVYSHPALKSILLSCHRRMPRGTWHHTSGSPLSPSGPCPENPRGGEGWGSYFTVALVGFSRVGEVLPAASLLPVFRNSLPYAAHPRASSAPAW